LVQPLRRCAQAGTHQQPLTHQQPCVFAHNLRGEGACRFLCRTREARRIVPLFMFMLRCQGYHLLLTRRAPQPSLRRAHSASSPDVDINALSLYAYHYMFAHCRVRAGGPPAAMAGNRAATPRWAGGQQRGAMQRRRAGHAFAAWLLLGSLLAAQQAVGPGFLSVTPGGVPVAPGGTGTSICPPDPGQVDPLAQAPIPPFRRRPPRAGAGARTAAGACCCRTARTRQPKPCCFPST
jgi:hypothetical protein